MKHPERAATSARLLEAAQPYFAKLIALSEPRSMDLDSAGFIAMGSPIEELFGTALNLVGRCSYDQTMYFGGPRDETEAVGLFATVRAAGRVTMCSFAQVQIGPYRVDFLVLYMLGDDIKSIVVECDGHDFHERTKEQASADKKRDRVLQEQGRKVFRFSGSDIWRDPIGCATQVWSSANKAMVLHESPGLEHLVQWGAPA